MSIQEIKSNLISHTTSGVVQEDKGIHRQVRFEPWKNLHSDICKYIFNFIPEMHLTLRCVDRKFKRIIDELYMNYWRKLKLSPPQGLVDIATLMNRIEQRFLGKLYIFLFEELKREFVSMGAANLKGRLPVTPINFDELQKQVEPNYAHSLKIIWKKVKENLEQLPETLAEKIINFTLRVRGITPPQLPNLTSAKIIKDWLNDPAHEHFIKKISRLDLSECHLRILPHEIGRFTQLQALRLCGNRLQSLPDTIGLLAQLRNLELPNNNLLSLPDTIGLLAQLQVLSLKNNCLKSLPDTIGLLAQLQVLDLKNNRLKSLPDTIGLLWFRLRELGLSNNFLQSFPNAISSLRLRYLNLAHNELQFIPDITGMDGCVKTYHFYFIGNPLICISTPADFFRTNSDECQEIIRLEDESHYQSKSILGKLYQSYQFFIDEKQIQAPLFPSLMTVINKNREEKIKALFSSLSTVDKNLVFEMVWVAAGSPDTEDVQWGEHHVFDRKQIDRFYRAVRKAILAKLSRLSQDQKNRVYGNVYMLAGKPLTIDCKWGEHHAKDNLPRLADAMEMQ